MARKITPRVYGTKLEISIFISFIRDIVARGGEAMEIDIKGD